MGLQRIAEPAAEPVDLATAKLFLKVDDTSEDTLITLQLGSAREWAENATRRALVSQRWRLTLPGFPLVTRDNPRAAIVLPRGRCLGVVRVAYIAADGSEVELTGPSSSPPGADFREDLTSDEGGLLLPPASGGWPAVDADALHPVTVDFDAGYGNAAAVPGPLKSAILYRLAELHELRGSQDGSWTQVALGALLPYALREA